MQPPRKNTLHWIAWLQKRRAGTATSGVRQTAPTGTATLAWSIGLMLMICGSGSPICWQIQAQSVSPPGPRVAALPFQSR